MHLLHSFWRVTETTKSVHAALKTPGTFAFARRMQNLTPEIIQQAMITMHEKGKKVTMQGLLSDQDVPELLKTALSSMQRCTSGVIGSNGHRKLLHREGIAYTLRFGPPLLFVTPNLADTKQPLLLVVQGEEFHFGENEGDFDHSYKEMVQRLARDPTGQTMVFELMIRLFFVHVLGIRPEDVGWRRGAARKSTGKRYFDGYAADFYEDSIFGCVAAAFGAIEAQGRGSLHPHVLVWLVLMSMEELLRTLMRERATFRERVSLWMKELVHAVTSVQESAVTELPRSLCGEKAASQPPLDLPVVPPIPMGPKERAQFGGTGERVTVPPDRVGKDADQGDQELYFCCPDAKDDEGQTVERWEPAVSPDMLYRNQKGEVVDKDA